MAKGGGDDEEVLGQLGERGVATDGSGGADVDEPEEEGPAVRPSRLVECLVDGLRRRADGAFDPARGVVVVHGVPAPLAVHRGARPAASSEDLPDPDAPMTIGGRTRGEASRRILCWSSTSRPWNNGASPARWGRSPKYGPPQHGPLPTGISSVEFGRGSLERLLTQRPSCHGDTVAESVVHRR